MPFQSERQRRYLYSQKPSVAAKFAHDSKKKYKKLHKKLKAKGSEPGALLRAAKSYRRTSIKKKGIFGETDIDKKTIKINKHLSKTVGIHGGKAKRGGVIDSITHEAYHAAHPKATEKETYKKTPKIVKKMSPKQKKRMYGLFK